MRVSILSVGLSSLLVSSLIFGGCTSKSSGGGDSPDDTEGDPTVPGDERSTPDATDDSGEPAQPLAPDQPATQPQQPADPRTAAYCEQDWEKYVTNHVVGLVMAYERTVKASGVIATESTRIWRKTVTEVSSDAITFEHVEQTIRPSVGEERRSTRTIPKAERFNDCLGLATTNDPTVTSEVLASREESIEVPAGTFQSSYVQNRETGTEEDVPYEHTSELWTIKGDLEIIAKAVTVWKTTKNDQPFEETATLTLTELRFPE